MIMQPSCKCKIYSLFQGSGIHCFQSEQSNPYSMADNKVLYAYLLSASNCNLPLHGEEHSWLLIREMNEIPFSCWEKVFFPFCPSHPVLLPWEIGKYLIYPLIAPAIPEIHIRILNRPILDAY